MKNARELAKEMLCEEELQHNGDLPEDLKMMLDRAEELTGLANGGIYSRQVVATIIMQWEAK